MSDSASDPVPKLAARERHLQLETDVFCVNCGYNLHGQPVTRDERLGIFVCRCPECGRYHPAGSGVTAMRPWLNRLGIGLVVFWVLIVLLAIFWIVMAMGAISVMHTEMFVNRKLVTMDGQPALWGPYKLPNGTQAYQVINKATSKPAGRWKTVYTLDKFSGDSPWGRRTPRVMDWPTFFGMTSLAAGLGFVTGLLAATFMWHWRRWGYRLALLLPFAISGVLIIIFALNEEYAEIFGWASRIALTYALLQAGFMALGIRIGRPIARGLLRMFVPPKARQHFAFLWMVDGKTAPFAQGEGAKGYNPSRASAT